MPGVGQQSHRPVIESDGEFDDDERHVERDAEDKSLVERRDRMVVMVVVSHDRLYFGDRIPDFREIDQLVDNGVDRQARRGVDLQFGHDIAAVRDNRMGRNASVSAICLLLMPLTMQTTISRSRTLSGS